MRVAILIRKLAVRTARAKNVPKVAVICPLRLAVGCDHVAARSSEKFVRAQRGFHLQDKRCR
jgi:hypothetical protein